MRFIKATTVYPISSNPIQNGVIVLNDKKQIIDVLPSDEGIEQTTIETHNGLICPGFINTHCHLELSHLKNQIPEKTGIVNFAKKIVSQRNNFMDELKQEAMFLANEEMQRNGIVAVGDISNDDSSIATKIKSTIHYHTFIELIGFNPANAQKIYAGGLELKKTFLNKGLSASLAPHAPYSVSLELMKLIVKDNNEYPCSIHNQESNAENNFFINGTGDLVDLYQSLHLPIDYFIPTKKTSLQSYLPQLLAKSKLLLVHNTFSSEADVTFAQQLYTNLYWCLCANANLYIEQTVPNVPFLMGNNCNITIGTDSLASNHQLSITSELSTLLNQFPNITIDEALNWATLKGAEFLGIQDVLGSIEKGKTPGLLLLTLKEKNIVIKKILA